MVSMTLQARLRPARFAALDLAAGCNVASDHRHGALRPAGLREKYRTERDKRLRLDGNDQYIEMTNRFAHYLDDPYCEPVERAPLTDDVGVVVIGGGFGGLLMGARLREAGIDDVRLIEKGGDVGGLASRPRYEGSCLRVLTIPPITPIPSSATAMMPIHVSLTPSR
jgi:hypothetical protein